MEVKVGEEQTASIKELIQKGKYPTVFKILLILSTINGAWSVLFGALGGFILSDESRHEDIKESYALLLQSMGGAENPDSVMDQIMEVGPSLLWVSALLGAFTLVSVFFMKNYQKLGFHIYVAVQLLSVFGVHALFGSPGASFPISSLLFSACFVWWYKRFYPLMN